MSFRCISVISRNPEQQWKLGRKELHNLQLRRLNSHAAVVSKAAPSKADYALPFAVERAADGATGAAQKKKAVARHRW